MNQKQADHHANQLNPNNPAHKQANDNHANQKNPTSSVYPKVPEAPTNSVKGE